MAVEFNRIDSERVKYRYGLGSNFNASQVNLDSSQVRTTPVAQPTTRSGDIVDISTQARSRYQEAQNETVAWEQSQKKTVESDSQKVTMEQIRKEEFNSENNRIIWEHTRRKIFNADNETEAVWEQSRKKTVESDGSSITWEEIKRSTPDSQKESVIWQQTKRKVVKLGQNKVNLEEAQSEIFDSAEGDENSSKNSNNKTSDTTDLEEQSHILKYLHRQAAVAYQYEVSAETAYQMNQMGYTGQTVFSLFA